MSDILQQGAMFTLLRQAYGERARVHGLEMGRALERHLQTHDSAGYERYIQGQVTIDIVRREDKKKEEDKYATRFDFYMYMSVKPDNPLYARIRDYYFWHAGPEKIRVHPGNGERGVEMVVEKGKITRDSLYSQVTLKDSNTYLRSMTLWLARILNKHPFDAGEETCPFPDRLGITLKPVELDEAHQRQLDGILSQGEFKDFARMFRDFGNTYQDNRYLFLMAEGAKLYKWFAREHPRECAKFLDFFKSKHLIITEAYEGWSEFTQKNFTILCPVSNIEYVFTKIAPQSCCLGIHHLGGAHYFYHPNDNVPDVYAELCKIVCDIFSGYPFARCGGIEWYL